jgi:hypothetical protein
VIRGRETASKEKPIRKKSRKAYGNGCQQIPGQNPGGGGCDRGNKVGIGERNLPVAFRQQNGRQG